MPPLSGLDIRCILAKSVDLHRELPLSAWSLCKWAMVARNVRVRWCCSSCEHADSGERLQLDRHIYWARCNQSARLLAHVSH